MLDVGSESDSDNETHHYDRFLPIINGVIIDHADDGHTEITADPKGDAKAKTREDGDDVATWQPEACAVHNGQLHLLHQLRPSLCWQLDSLAILLTLFDDPGGRTRMYVEVPL